MTLPRLLRTRSGWLLALPALLAVIAGLIIPVLGVIATTFLDERGPFASYIAFFNSGFRMTVLVRTLEIAAMTTSIALVFGFVTAYVVARAPPRWRSLLIILAVFPLLTGVVVRAFAWLIILGKNGIVNNAAIALGLTAEPFAMLYTKGAVVTGMVYLFIPLMVLSIVGVIENIPDDVMQAASSLGASPIAAFWQVLMPLAVPGLIVGAVLVFTGSFTAYATPQLLGGEQQTVLATLLQHRAMVVFDWAGASTIATIMVVITLSVVTVLSRIARRLNPMAA